MKTIRSFTACILSALMLLCLISCGGSGNVNISSLSITNCERATLGLGYTLQLETNAPDSIKSNLKWEASNGCVTIDDFGFVTAKDVGSVAVKVSYGNLSDSALITVKEDVTGGITIISPAPQGPQDDHESNPYDGPTQSTLPSVPDSDNDDGNNIDEAARDAFYGNSDPADSYAEALERSARGEISGATTVPNQAPTLSAIRPTKNGKYIRNNEPYYIDNNTYVVVNAYGEEVFRVYRGGGYITLEEVAAYLYAFGDVPANYISGKNKSPQGSIWGKYLRLNHTSFSGDTDKYPYEPELPDIRGCGGDLYYYEIDIGTTGTDCDPSYSVKIYNDGKTITRGAARIVYTRYDANKNQIIDPNEKYVFYTYNHYNDFQEYLNYYGGWGVMFGNVTGGGTLSSKKNYNPTPYVPSTQSSLPERTALVAFNFVVLDPKKYWMGSTVA